MSEFKTEEQIKNAKTVWTSFKTCFRLIREKKYFGAVKEVCSLLKLLYDKFLKGRKCNIKGIRVPYTAIAIVAVLAGWAVLPDTDVPEEETVAETEKKDTNTYNKDDIKVYAMQKCKDDTAVCGLLENGREEAVSHVKISVTFRDRKGVAVYEGVADAQDVAPMGRIKFNIPSSEEFDYFVLTDVTVE